MLDNVKDILEKYWAGESSLEEEKQLREYFQRAEVAKELEPYRSLFGYFNEQQKIAMSVDAQTLIKNVEDQAVAKTKKLRLPAAFWRMAAAIALMIGFFIAYQQTNYSNKEQIVWEETYDSPEEAYQKTKEVLLLVSRKMKTGTDKAAYSMNKAQVATNLIKN